MADPDALDALNSRPDARLSRRSLVAAGALLAALGPTSARADHKGEPHGNGEQTDIPGCGPSENTPPKCQCLLSGTRLLTPAGEVAIEDLAIGDLVTTESGEARTIRWIGRITVDRQDDAPWHVNAMPVLVRKGAFGVGRPSRDLYLSHAHMVHLNGVLIPIGDLINGRTIVAADVPGGQIVYYHVELETHDVVIAEGAPCETLLTTAEKVASFDNADEYFALYGTPVDMTPYAPFAAFNGGRSEFKSRLRSALAPVIDIRQPLDIVRDNLEARSLLSKAA